jgi:NitT/TauT family transport system substrate-binding protein
MEIPNALCNNIIVQPFLFNGGPSAIKTSTAKKINVTYIGPNPAINGYVASAGKD